MSDEQFSFITFPLISPLFSFQLPLQDSYILSAKGILFFFFQDHFWVWTLGFHLWNKYPVQIAYKNYPSGACYETLFSFFKAITWNIYYVLFSKHIILFLSRPFYSPIIKDVSCSTWPLLCCTQMNNSRSWYEICLRIINNWAIAGPSPLNTTPLNITLPMPRSPLTSLPQRQDMLFPSPMIILPSIGQSECQLLLMPMSHIPD